jgi:hypothetical protein
MSVQNTESIVCWILHRAHCTQFWSLGYSELVVYDIVKLVYLLLMKEFHVEMSKWEPK